MEQTTKVSLKDVIKIEYLTPANAVFTEKIGFISLCIIGKDENGAEKRSEYERVTLHRNFPYKSPEEFISVLDKDKNEVGMIRSFSDFPQETADLLRREIDRKYFVFYIEKIISVNEQYGYGYVKAVTGGEIIEFTVQDPYRSISRITQDRIYISDIDGNRYEIPSLDALDRASYKKIELYL